VAPPSIRLSRSSPAFSCSASFWPRSLGASPRLVSVVRLGSSSAHRPPKRQQIDRSSPQGLLYLDFKPKPLYPAAITSSNSASTAAWPLVSLT
jgi:hypothetical protein